MNGRSLALTACACALGAAAPRAVQAQMLPDRPDVAGSRAQPEFDPIGVRLGPWKITPKMKATLGYDSNLYGLTDDVVTDRFAIYSPSIAATSDWARHWLRMNASASLTRYADHPRQNTNEYNIVAQGGIDLGRVQILPSVTASQNAERRGTNGTPLTRDEPSLYRSTVAGVEVRSQSGKIVTSVGVAHSSDSFSSVVLPNGADDRQRFRDTSGWSATARVAVAPTPSSSVFLSASYGRQNAEKQAGIDQRTNTRTTLLGGVSFDAGLIRGEVAAGYLEQRFTNSIFKDYNGLTYRGTLIWYPTKLVTVEFDANRLLQNSGVASVGALVTDAQQLKIVYELLRNLNVNLQLRHSYDRFPEIRSKSTLISQTLSAEYQFNKIVSLGAYERYECRDSSRSLEVRHYCAFLTGMSLGVTR